MIFLRFLFLICTAAVFYPSDPKEHEILGSWHLNHIYLLVLSSASAALFHRLGSVWEERPRIRKMHVLNGKHVFFNNKRLQATFYCYYTVGHSETLILIERKNYLYNSNLEAMATGKRNLTRACQFSLSAKMSMSVFPKEVVVQTSCFWVGNTLRYLQKWVQGTSCLSCVALILSAREELLFQGFPP